MLYDKGEGSGDVFSGGGWMGGLGERAENKDWLEPINCDMLNNFEQFGPIANSCDI